MIVTFPDSPYELHQPFAPAGDQPEAIDKLVEGIDDGLAFQTLLGVTGSGKTFTMANVIARIGRPAIVFAPNKTLAAQLYSEFREFFPKNAVEYFVSLLRLLPARGLRPVARPVHREGLARSTSTSSRCACRRPRRCSSGRDVRDRRDGVGDLRHRRPVRIPQHDPAPAPGRQAGQRDVIARLIRDAVHAQRDRLPARHVPRARRHDRHLPGGARRAGDPHRAVRRRGRVAAAVRSADRARAPEDAALHRLSRRATT